MRKMFQKTFTLDFTKSESMYKEEQELDAPKGPSANGGVMVMSDEVAMEFRYII